MPYPKADLFEFTLESIGAPEFKLTCADPANLPWSIQRKAQQAQFIMMRLIKGNVVPGQDEDWALTIWDEVLHAVLKGWNLPYPEGHPREGEVIPLCLPEPAVFDADGKLVKAAVDGEADPFGAIPTPAWGVLVEEVGRRLTAAPKRAK
jgi:hypothetical protein